MYHNVAYLAAYCYTSKPTPSSFIIFWHMQEPSELAISSHFTHHLQTASLIKSSILGSVSCPVELWNLYFLNDVHNGEFSVRDRLSCIQLNSQLQWLVSSHNSELPTSIPKNLQAQSAAKRGKALWTCSQVQQSNSSSLVFPGTSACQVARGQAAQPLVSRALGHLRVSPIPRSSKNNLSGWPSLQLRQFLAVQTWQSGWSTSAWAAWAAWARAAALSAAFFVSASWTASRHDHACAPHGDMPWRWYKMIQDDTKWYKMIQVLAVAEHTSTKQKKHGFELVLERWHRFVAQDSSIGDFQDLPLDVILTHTRLVDFNGAIMAYPTTKKGVSWNGGIPIAAWFIMESLKINGWKLGVPSF